MGKRLKGLVIMLTVTALTSVVSSIILWWSPAMASETAATGPAVSEAAVQWSFIAAALATGLSSLGAGIAVAAVGSAAIGALAEKPELLGRTLILVGLAEGIAIYGLIVSILIFNQIT